MAQEGTREYIAIPKGRGFLYAHANQLYNRVKKCLMYCRKRSHPLTCLVIVRKQQVIARRQGRIYSNTPVTPNCDCTAIFGDFKFGLVAGGRSVVAFNRRLTVTQNTDRNRSQYFDITQSYRRQFCERSGVRTIAKIVLIGRDYL